MSRDAGGVGEHPENHAALLLAFDTPRLHLRPIGESDEALFCRLYTDPEVMRHIALPMTVEAALRSFGTACRQQSWTKQRWILVDHASAVPASIGLLGLFVDPDATQGPSAEIGVVLLDGWQCRGYAAEAIMAVAERVFSAGVLERLWTRHAPGNALAAGLMEKLRFTQCDLDDATPLQRRWTLQRSRWLQDRGRCPAVAMKSTGR